MKTIVKANIVESDCVGPFCEEGKQYLNFQKLKKQLTKKELFDLTKSNNAVLRSYAYREIIKPNNKNTINFLNFELDKNERVSVFEGCSISEELVSSLVYHDYWNKIRIEAGDKVDSKNQEELNFAMQKRLESDHTMEKLDSIIIFTNKDNFWLLYLRAFENRKHKDSYLPRIEKLAFEKNNAYALFYLEKYYNTQFKEKIKSYFENEFPKVSFKDQRDYDYFVELIEYLIKSNNHRFTGIAIEKLKQDESVWKNDSYQIMNLLEDSSIKL